HEPGRHRRAGSVGETGCRGTEHRPGRGACRECWAQSLRDKLHLFEEHKAVFGKCLPGSIVGQEYCKRLNRRAMPARAWDDEVVTLFLKRQEAESKVLRDIVDRNAPVGTTLCDGGRHG